jgi:hypothetical protein
VYALIGLYYIFEGQARCDGLGRWLCYAWAVLDQNARWCGCGCALLGRFFYQVPVYVVLAEKKVSRTVGGGGEYWTAKRA